MTTSTIKILIVDDEPPIRKLLRVGLGTEGYTISEAENARQAIDITKTGLPDLILLDLGLPDMRDTTSSRNGGPNTSICRS